MPWLLVLIGNIDANGYLVNQFISAHSNHREDEYGGSLNNRLRFLREVVEAVAEVVGADRLGVRFAPLFESKRRSCLHG
jgi:N-ethylmaleimide reductase